MAENNNNTFTVTITPKTFNGIITGNGDGTYNVAYTSLTKDQIDEIGKQFADRLSDEESGLKKIARTGEYKDLEKKPGIPNGYTQESTFNKVAFSGKASDLNNDEGFLTATTNAYTGSPAANITNQDIINWNNKSNFNGNYNELNNLPNLFDFEVINLDTDYPEVNLNTSTTMELINNNCVLTIQQIIQNGQLPILKQQSNYYLINNYSIENNTYFRATFINITDTFEDAVVNHSDNIVNYVKIHKFFIHIFFYDILNNKSYLKNSQILNDYVTQYDYDVTIGEIWGAINELQQSN